MGRSGQRVIDSRLVTDLREVVNDRLPIVEELYRRMKEPGAGVPAKRFRADHRHVRNDIADLERRSLITKNYDGSQEMYRASLLVLPLIAAKSANKVLKASDRILRYLSAEYIRRLDDQMSVTEILTNVHAEPITIRYALFFLKGTPAIGGGSTDFPVNDNSYTVLSEQLLDYDCLQSLLSVMLPWVVGSRRAAELQANTLISESATDAFDALFHQDLEGHWTSTLPIGLKDVIGEVRQALKAGLTFIPALGIRTAIEMCCVHKIGRQDRLPILLEEMVSAGYLSPASAASLNPVVELGNASAHIGYQPQPSDVEIAVAVTAALLRQLYHIAPLAQGLSQRVPKRARSKLLKKQS